MKYYVYYLYSHLDPEGVRYVGKTCNPTGRLAGHMAKNAWVKAMGRENVSMFILEEHDTEDFCFHREKHHIARLRSLGCNLLNISEGGRLPKYYPHTPKAKKVREPVYKAPTSYPPMSPATLMKIRKTERLPVDAFAARLGISRNTLGGYEKGKQPIPNYIALACTAIYRRMEAIE